MSPTPPTNTNFEVDALDFELTDFEEARRAHDALPEGVEKLPELDPNYWEMRRHRPGPTDRALAGSTIDWLIALPLALRPKALCDTYPRAANAIAAAWHAPSCPAVLDELLESKRPGRRGFPPEIRAEIQALRDALDVSAPAAGEKPGRAPR